MNSEEIEREFGYTERQLDEMAAEYEDGTWEGCVGPVVYGNLDAETARRVMDEYGVDALPDCAEKQKMSTIS